MEIKYLDHPCSAADKKKWNDKGFKVLDIRFAPEDLEGGDKLFPKNTEVKKGTVAWYKEELTKLEVEFDDSATKGELTAIYEDATSE